MSDREDTSVEAVEMTSAHEAVDLGPGVAEPLKLRVRHHAMLFGRQRGTWTTLIVPTTNSIIHVPTLTPNPSRVGDGALQFGVNVGGGRG